LEFCYKYNNRENANVFNNLLSNAVCLWMKKFYQSKFMTPEK
jgi:hypothetical protein